MDVRIEMVTGYIQRTQLMTHANFYVTNPQNPARITTVDNCSVGVCEGVSISECMQRVIWWYRVVAEVDGFESCELSHQQLHVLYVADGIVGQVALL